ncbi:MAG: Nuclear actin-protein involved in chromatin remodeling [Thelocarpon impressellum]|nr:MAG: Nuclear actin-protein involved in chromatin remodeling [Thelocarpon impressellum]
MTPTADGSSAEPATDNGPPQALPRVWNAREPPFQGYLSPQSKAFERSSEDTAIVIDNGSSAVRAGWSFDSSPRIQFPPIMSRYRDRKLGRTFTFVGSEAYADATTRGQIRNAFEAASGVVSNWDVMEGILDYTFLKLGVDGADGGVGRPIVMTEPAANLGYSRKMMTEILFECYSAPSVAYGIDSLFAYQYNDGKTGLVLSSSHTSTHLIPVLDSNAMLTQATRLNWGGSQGAEYLLKLLQLKYPHFPGKFSSLQAEEMVREHCHVSQNYDDELRGFLDWTGLEDRDRVIQYPFTEQVVVQKSEEELARIAEKRKEGGRRLQEQAAKMRLEKLIKKEQELEYYKDLQAKAATETKKEFKRLLESNDFETEAQLDKIIRDLDKSIRKARTKDVGGPENEDEEEEQTFPLLDVPDAELDEAGLKQKRHQRLMKSNVDARARAKAEKEKEKARIEEERRLDQERRETDLEGWVQDRRAARENLLQKIKERQRLKADLGNRKSLASQMRMKSIANLASDNPSKKRRRGNATGGDNDDMFGANDDDWGVYRTIATGEGSDDEADNEDEMLGALKTLEAQLLEHDASFTSQHTLDAESDWSKSLIHAFLRGPRPFDPESARESHQVHLNVERIRVPEVVFQPSIAGIDQAGIVEIASDVLTQRLAPAVADQLLRDVFVTGGNTLFQGFDARLRAELRAVLPADAALKVRRARDPVLDAWRGAARWSASDAWSGARVTRGEYAEKGGEYLKEHGLGNAYST